jgi:CDP-paratose 2-epimerase
MKVVLVTGSGGLIGSETVAHYATRSSLVVGVDNDLRAEFFGREASTAWQVQHLRERFGERYRHEALDVRDCQRVRALVAELGSDLSLIVHCAAQPSHDWAAADPFTDFTVNANGTLVLLEAMRAYAPMCTFIFCSTNKVYGNRPNLLPLVELDGRWEVVAEHPFFPHGIDESMSVDTTLHSLFGASKLAADLVVQEYGLYFGLNTVCFRGGCLTGPGHAGTRLHGFLAYLMKCTFTGEHYTVFGYKAKQVRDNIHAADLVSAFDAYAQAPRPGEVYNIGGGRPLSCSVREAIAICEEVAERPLSWSYSEENRIGDHMWWISDTRKFQSHYPSWNITYSLRDILVDIAEGAGRRWL